MDIKRNNKGLSLVELIAAIAITSILILVIATAIDIFARGFIKSDHEIDLQKQAQLTLSLLSDKLLEAKEISASTDNEGNPRYLITGVTSGEGEAAVVNYYEIIFVQSSGMLFLVHSTRGSLEGIPESMETQMLLRHRSQYLLSEQVESFELQTDDSKSTVTISLSLKEGDRDYTVKTNLNLRNGS